MNILYTITAYPPSVGGAQSHTHEIARRLAATHSVRVMSFWRENRTDWLLGTTLRAPWDPASYEQDGVLVHPLCLSAAERALLTPYVVGYYGLMARSIDRIAEQLAPQLMEHARDASLVHNARVGREPLSFASLKVARKLDIPFVFTPYHHPRWVGWRYREYLALYRLADAVIALTQSEREILARLGVSPDRIHVTGSGPVLSSASNGAAVRRRHGLDQEPVVLFLGQQYRYKGIESILQAAPLVWKRRPETRFVFLGPRTRFSTRLFSGVADGRVIEKGSVSLQEKTDWLAACDLLCVPSSQESFGGIYTEAWMLEKPVIGGDVPAVSEVVTEGEDGFLVAQQPDAISERILWLLDNPTRAAEMGKHGRRKVLANYSWDRLTEKTLDVYQKVAGTTP